MTTESNKDNYNLLDPLDRFLQEPGELQVFRSHEIWDGSRVTDILTFEKTRDGQITVKRTSKGRGGEWHARVEELRRVGENRFIAMIRGGGRVGPLTGTIDTARFHSCATTSGVSRREGTPVNLAKEAHAFPHKHLSDAMKMARSRLRWLAFEIADENGIASIVFVPPGRRLLAEFYFDGKPSRVERLLGFSPSADGISVTTMDNDDIVRSFVLKNPLDLRLLSSSEVGSEFSAMQPYVDDVDTLVEKGLKRAKASAKGER